MAEALVETLELENHLTLKIYDASRQIAGDRWQVTLIARLEVPVDPSVADINEIEWEKIQAALGPKVFFEQKRERNFIAAETKDDVFRSLRDKFAATQMPYLTHAEFAKRYILNRYSEHHQKTGRA